MSKFAVYMTGSRPTEPTEIVEGDAQNTSNGIMYIHKGDLEDDNYEIVFQAPADKVHRIVKVAGS